MVVNRQTKTRVICKFFLSVPNLSQVVYSARFDDVNLRKSVVGCFQLRVQTLSQLMLFLHLSLWMKCRCVKQFK